MHVHACIACTCRCSSFAETSRKVRMIGLLLILKSEFSEYTIAAYICLYIAYVKPHACTCEVCVFRFWGGGVTGWINCICLPTRNIFIYRQVVASIYTTKQCTMLRSMIAIMIATAMMTVISWLIANPLF